MVCFAAELPRRAAALTKYSSLCQGAGQENGSPGAELRSGLLKGRAGDAGGFRESAQDQSHWLPYRGAAAEPTQSLSSF